MFDGFKKFILRGNVVDLAVGIVIGSAFTDVVQAMVKGLITPLISAFGAAPDFSKWSFTINKSTFYPGDFINALISFLILAFVVYFLVITPVNKLVSLTAQKKKPEEPTDKKCPYCFTAIPIKAVRCPNCTSTLKKS